MPIATSNAKHGASTQHASGKDAGTLATAVGIAAGPGAAAIAASFGLIG
ncbi:hypothetical protein [Actinopolyspora halophila]|nr:hypothetical protein [Actinopolyspora halophila]